MLTIVENEIDYIQVIGESKNKVLIVKQRNSNRPVVVKSEEANAQNASMQAVKEDALHDSRSNVGAMLEFHGTVFSKLRSLPFDTERLTLNEINQLKSCKPGKIRGLNPGETWSNIFETEVLRSDGRIKSVVKISYIEALANLNGIAKDLNQLNVMRDCLDHGDTSFVFELGQILAVDFFVGNHDRFDDVGRLTGPQNIFFQLKNNSIKATGIDTYDVFGRWSNLSETIEVLEKNGTKWPGRMLAHGAFSKREELANKAVSQIILMAFDGGITGREPFPKPSTIGVSRKKVLVTTFHKGMSEAKSILRKKYKLDGNISGLQSGIRSRWNIIRG